MPLPLQITRELLLVGGGHTAALVLRMWRMNPLPGVRLTVINRHASAPYSGMLPGFVAEHYLRAELDIDLVRLARIANAMTDVTGSGLAGHLKEISDASDVGATLDLDVIPFLDGAVELAAAGVRSSIFADNCALVPEMTPGDDPKVALLLDPQTVGGVLAGVPENALEPTPIALWRAGNSPAVIGRCTKASDGFRHV